MLTQALILAATDEITIGLGLVNMALSVALGLGLFALNSRQRKIETLETRVEKAIETAIDGKLTGLSDDIDRHEERLKCGESEFARLREDDHKLQLEVISRLDRLSEKLDTKYATSGDVRRLDERVSRMESWKEQRQV